MGESPTPAHCGEVAGVDRALEPARKGQFIQGDPGGPLGHRQLSNPHLPNSGAWALGAGPGGNAFLKAPKVILVARVRTSVRN